MVLLYQYPAWRYYRDLHNIIFQRCKKQENHCIRKDEQDQANGSARSPCICTRHCLDPSNIAVGRDQVRMERCAHNCSLRASWRLRFPLVLHSIPKTRRGHSSSSTIEESQRSRGSYSRHVSRRLIFRFRILCKSCDIFLFETLF